MINKVKISNLYLLIATLLLCGCKSKEDDLINEQEEWPVGQNVYVAGFESLHDNNVARLWKNGNIQNLSGNAGTSFRADGVVSSIARSVFVSGDDVYVAGYDVISNETEVIARARLWKNGIMQNLPNGVFSDEAISVFVSGNDVYVLGREALDPKPFPSSWAFKVWKNGKAEIFAEGNSQWQVNSLFVSNGNVYVAGCGTKTFGSSNVQQAKLWKNGVAEDISSETIYSCANSVFVSGNDIYVSGFVYEQSGNNTIARLWKNGKAENLTNGTKSAKAYSVYISGNDLYVSGHDGDDARLWKNGIVQPIVDTNDARVFLSVFVKDNDVYTSGYVEAVQDVEKGNLPIHYFQATLWKNGKKLKLKTEGKYNNSRALSVFVK